MDESFFERPILNSPYASPPRHWELDADGQPTNRIIETRRRSELITPVPKPQKRRRSPAQEELRLAAADGLSTAEQEYNPTPIINEIRGHVDAWRDLPGGADWGVTPITQRVLEHWRSADFSSDLPDAVLDRGRLRVSQSWLDAALSECPAAVPACAHQQKFDTCAEYPEANGGDLLSMLIRAQDEAEPGAAMTDVNVRDEALTLFLSGHETMAMALTWTWYLLAQDHEVEAKLQAEIDDVLGAGPPSLAAVSELHYAKMVFTEAMRLYPPAWCIVRYVIKDYEVGGYAMPAGSTVIMSQYVMHRDERYFPDPSRFDPQRWTPEAKSARPQYSYFPFGGGPRVCVGDALAWAEGVLILASLAQRWRMHLPPGHNVTAKPMIALVPKHGMPMILEQREASSDT